jgi:hypothetical protein
MFSCRGAGVCAGALRILFVLDNGANGSLIASLIGRTQPLARRVFFNIL